MQSHNERVRVVVSRDPGVWPEENDVVMCYRTEATELQVDFQKHLCAGALPHILPIDIHLSSQWMVHYTSSLQLLSTRFHSVQWFPPQHTTNKSVTTKETRREPLIKVTKERYLNTEFESDRSLSWPLIEFDWKGGSVCVEIERSLVVFKWALSTSLYLCLLRIIAQQHRSVSIVTWRMYVCMCLGTRNVC
jgi:hypothetical protein